MKIGQIIVLTPGNPNVLQVIKDDFEEYDAQISAEIEEYFIKPWKKISGYKAAKKKLDDYE